MRWANPSDPSQSLQHNNISSASQAVQHVKEDVKTSMVNTRVQPAAARTKIHCRKQHTVENPTEKKKPT
jgi:hypothetical protein